MGAHDGWTTFEAPNHMAALKAAVRIMRDLCHEHGHAPYSGHIGTAHGVDRRMCGGPPMSEAQARAFIFGHEDAEGEWVDGVAEKWGPAVLVPIKNKGSRKRKWLLGAVCAT